MEVCVAVGRDMGEFPADGAVLNSDFNVRYRTLVVRGSQLANGEVLDASTKLHNGKKQGEGADMHWPRRLLRGGKRELRWSRA